MTQANRDTLIKHFQVGSRPTADHFSELIYSTLNIVEDGIYKTKVDGLQVRALPNARGLLSFYRPQSADDADWSLVFGERESQLVFRAGTAGEGNHSVPLVTLDSARQGSDPPPGAPGPFGRVGIGTAAPRPDTRLDVDGVVGMRGRIGSAAEVPEAIVANGKYQPITGRLLGCNAFEIMAGVGRPDSEGRFALLHAFAMNVHNPSRWNDWFGRKKRIHQQQVWYERGCDRLELSWIGGNGKGQEYRLAIRTRCDYQAETRRACRKAGKELAPSEEVRIQVHVTQLWFDPNMNGSARQRGT